MAGALPYEPGETTANRSSKMGIAVADLCQMVDVYDFPTSSEGWVPDLVDAEKKR